MFYLATIYLSHSATESIKSIKIICDKMWCVCVWLLRLTWAFVIWLWITAKLIIYMQLSDMLSCTYHVSVGIGVKHHRELKELRILANGWCVDDKPTSMPIHGSMVLDKFAKTSIRTVSRSLNSICNARFTQSTPQRVLFTCLYKNIYIHNRCVCTSQYINSNGK